MRAPAALCQGQILANDSGHLLELFPACLLPGLTSLRPLPATTTHDTYVMCVFYVEYSTCIYVLRVTY